VIQRPRPARSYLPAADIARDCNARAFIASASLPKAEWAAA